MSHLWQHPYVNVFKHFDVGTWKKSSKEGDVAALMDKTLKCTVYKVAGSIPAGNYIQLPKTTSQSLGLTGRFFYLLFKPIPGKYFVCHLDVATSDGLVVRVSFSNLFKEFKSTSTWLQFPFVCHASKGSVSDRAAAGVKGAGGGPAPLHVRFTMLTLDLQALLAMYLNRKFSYVKTVKLCANILVKNIVTSDNYYEPGVTAEQIRRLGLLGKHPVPRDINFHVGKGQKWHDLYDHIRFPTESTRQNFDMIEMDTSITAARGGVAAPIRVEPRVVDVTRPMCDKVSVIDQSTTPKLKGPRTPAVSELPRVGVDENGDISECDPRRAQDDADDEVHVYAHPGRSTEQLITRGRASKATARAPNRGTAVRADRTDHYHSLKPDPILKLRRIVGFGGSSCRDALWTSNGTTAVYPSHAVVVAMTITNGHQRFFIGHTDKVSCIALSGSSALLASGQTGPQSVVRVWRFDRAECLAMFKTHAHSLHALSMSHGGGVLCGVGRDNHGKNMVVIWGLDQVTKGGQVAVLAKAHTDVDIVRMRIAGFDDTRMVSCGRDNIRLWRVKDGSLRSAPVNLGEYHSMEFSDCCFEAGYDPAKDPLDRTVYACSKSGHVFEVDYRKVAITHVRRLLPVVSGPSKEKQTLRSAGGIAISALCVTESFCVTGSDDGFLRLWPLDFRHVHLEAQHEGPVTAVDVADDGIRVLAGTSSGNLGILDISTRNYTTVMRSHTARISHMTLDPLRRHLATVSEDHTIRVWDLDTMQQLYDFSAPKEAPVAIAYHPREQIFACGFESGSVRVFCVSNTSMLAEHRQHRGRVTGLAYSPCGSYLFSSGSLGALALYDATDQRYAVLRVLANTVCPGDTFGPNALAVSPDGGALAFVGPTEFTVSVVAARSLDEILRLDISCVSPPDSARSPIDAARTVCYTPASVKQLLVTTAKNKLLKFDARSGKILAEVENIHRSGCTALDVSPDGRHLVTAGDRVLKVWDYHMRLDLNFQVFIGHAEPIQSVLFSPDCLSLISTAEGIFIWDFLAHNVTLPELEGRTVAKSYYTGEEEPWLPYQPPASGMPAPQRAPPGSVLSDTPRKAAPQPTRLYEPGSQVADLSDIQRHGDDVHGEDVVSEVSAADRHHDDPDSDSDHGDHIEIVTTGSKGHQQRSPGHQHRSPGDQRSHRIEQDPRGDVSIRLHNLSVDGPLDHPPPAVHKHFRAKARKHALAQRRYTAPPAQAGLRLRALLGYNGNGRDNMVWAADTGLFVYSSGQTVVVEELDGGRQTPLHGHCEEVSTLALQHDCQVLASASGRQGVSPSQILVWDMKRLVCKKSLPDPHAGDVVCLAYSRDDRFLVSVGDYRECRVIVWSSADYTHLASTTTAQPVHAVRWDPSCCNEFASVGACSSLCFWLLDETGTTVSLNVHEAEVPREARDAADLTSLCYTAPGDSSLYVGSAAGHMTAWDTRKNTCYMTWDADIAEIGCVVVGRGRLVTGSAGGSLRQWTADAADGSHTVVMEDEMTLDAPVTAAAFDDTLDMGIVGTAAGTLWYINWTERTSIRLVSGHACKIVGLACHGGDHLATSCEDGSLRVWSLADREQMLQFRVIDQPCNCVCFSPHTLPSKKLPAVAAGYGDGTMRVFDLDAVEMSLKMHPHAAAVTAIAFSSDGRMLLSGSADGLVAVSSPTTGMTVRVISDHKGAPVTCIDVTTLQVGGSSLPSSPLLWLAASGDRRVSVWSADWSRDCCELVDWLTFPAPAYTPDGTVITMAQRMQPSYYESVPPTLAAFSREEPDVVVYTGYGLEKTLLFYSLSDRKVLRSVALTHWATSLHLSPTAPVIALGNNERLLKLLDYYEGSFQDYTGHNDGVAVTRFSPDGRLLVSAADNEVIVWEVNV